MKTTCTTCGKEIEGLAVWQHPDYSTNPPTIRYYCEEHYNAVRLEPAPSDPPIPASAEPHRLQFVLTKGDELDRPTVKVICPHGGSLDPERPCQTWQEHAKDNSCECDCEGCKEGNHEDCESDWVPEVGNKFCQCHPTGQCWYEHAMKEVGGEMFSLMGDLVSFEFNVKLRGFTWDEPIEVFPVVTAVE